MVRNMYEGRSAELSSPTTIVSQDTCKDMVTAGYSQRRGIRSTPHGLISSILMMIISTHMI